MKKVFAILFISVFFLNCFCNAVLFTYLQKALKSRVFAEIRKSPKLELLQRLEISRKTIAEGIIYRKVEEKEFYYKGNLFDIVKKEYTENSVVFYCIRDIAEESLISRFVNDGSAPNSLARLYHRLRALLNGFAFDALISKKVAVEKDLFYNYSSILKIIITNTFFKPPYPPPRFI